MKVIEKQFEELLSLIENQRSAASQAVNEKQLTTAWFVGGYISEKLKTEEWGSKVVSQFAEYIKVHAPELKGFSRRNIYNFVMFYEEYSSFSFVETVQTYLPSSIVQKPSAQTDGTSCCEIVQKPSAQMNGFEIVQMPSTQLWKLLCMTSYSNHIAILCQCRSLEQRLFYILYANRERLKYKELQRCIANDTFSSLLGRKKNMSKALLAQYPQAPILFKDTAFVDYLGLPKKHTEPKLRKGLVEHMKQFILELGKDFLFVDQEYYLEVGVSRYKSDLLFYHRGLQCLVAIELKKTKFHPSDLGQLEFYLEALDRDVKRTNENPSIGMILCPEADEKVVEYALSRSLSPAMVAQYKRLLIPKEKVQVLLKEYCEYMGANK